MLLHAHYIMNGPNKLPWVEYWNIKSVVWESGWIRLKFVLKLSIFNWTIAFTRVGLSWGFQPNYGQHKGFDWSELDFQSPIEILQLKAISTRILVWIYIWTNEELELVGKTIKNSYQ